MNDRADGGNAISTAVAVIGGGPAGMTLALALRQRGIGCTVFEARTREAVRQDARILALSHGSRQILERLAAWPAQATPIAAVHVSHRAGLGRARINARELDVPALGYVVPARELIATLDAALQARGIDYREGVTVRAEGIVADNESIHGDGLRASLLAWAEGSVDPQVAQQRDYGQHAVLCTVAVSPPHGNVAYERFTDEGPLALLPLGADYAVVLTADSSRVETLLQLDDAGFRRELSARFGGRHQFGALGPRVAYPLGLKWRGDVIGPRQVWLGNAAQTLHPVAGQGFNLALRDIWELSQVLQPSQDPGTPAVLTAYAQRRRLDRHATIGFTDLLIDAFAHDFPPLRHLRGAGLVALDLIPPLRNFVARRLMFGSRGGL